MWIVPDSVDVRFGENRTSLLHGTYVALRGLVGEKLQVAL